MIQMSLRSGNTPKHCLPCHRPRSVNATDGNHPLSSQSVEEPWGPLVRVGTTGKQLSEEADASLRGFASRRPYISGKLQNLEISCFEWKMQILWTIRSFLLICDSPLFRHLSCFMKMFYRLTHLPTFSVLHQGFKKNRSFGSIATVLKRL